MFAFVVSIFQFFYSPVFLLQYSEYFSEIAFLNLVLAKAFIGSILSSFMIEWIFLLAGILEVVLPVSVAIYVWKKFGISWIVFVLGAVIFLVSLVRIPLNLLVQNNLGSYFFGTSLLVVGAFFPSLTAGLFEEGFRFLGFRYLFRSDKRDWQHA